MTSETRKADTEFLSCDLGLIAFLLCFEAKLQCVRPFRERQMQFVVTVNGTTIDATVSAYYRDEALVEPKRYRFRLGELKRMVASEQAKLDKKD